MSHLTQGQRTKLVQLLTYLVDLDIDIITHLNEDIAYEGYVTNGLKNNEGDMLYICATLPEPMAAQLLVDLLEMVEG